MAKQFSSIHYRQGFTLIETFVAITILLIVIIGPLSTIAKFYADNNAAKDMIAANFLAQDAIETAINLAQNSQRSFAQSKQSDGCLGFVENNPTNTDWQGELKGCVLDSLDSAGGCKVDGYIQKVASCSSIDDCLLYKKKDNGFYTIDSGSLPDGNELTKFKRQVRVVAGKTTAANQTDDQKKFRSLDILAIVKWNNKGSDRVIEVKTKIFLDICNAS